MGFSHGLTVSEEDKEDHYLWVWFLLRDWVCAVRCTSFYSEGRIVGHRGSKTYPTLKPIWPRSLSAV